MSEKLESRLIHSLSDFEHLRDEWNSLLAQNRLRSAVLTWEWAFAWWSVYRAQKELWLVTIRKGENLVGVAPFMLEKRRRAGVSLRVLTTLGTPMNDVGGFILRGEEEAVVEEIAALLLQKRSKWDVLEMSEFLAEGVEVRLFGRFFSAGEFYRLEKQNEHYYLPIQKTWDEFYKTLSRKFRENLRRAERNAKKRGQVTLQKYTGANLRWANFEEVITINRHAYYPSLCHSESEQAFLRALYSLAKQWLAVYVLYIEREPVGYRYGFLYDNKFEDWRTGFDTRYPSSLSIGKLAASKVIFDAFESQLAEVDFMRGAHAYKQKWQPKSRFFTQIRFFRKRSLRAYLAYAWLYKIKPILKRERENE
jgi:CelD/BcsL family acetyltransferase involved in cellulose biosynthesis